MIAIFLQIQYHHINALLFISLLLLLLCYILRSSWENYWYLMFPEIISIVKPFIEIQFKLDTFHTYIPCVHCTFEKDRSSILIETTFTICKLHLFSSSHYSHSDWEVIVKFMPCFKFKYLLDNIIFKYREILLFFSNAFSLRNISTDNSLSLYDFAVFVSI